MPITDTNERLDGGNLLKKYRVQLDFTSSDFDRINLLVKELGLGTRAELFREAVLTLEWLVDNKKQGHLVTSTTPEGRCLEPQFGVLRNVRSTTCNIREREQMHTPFSVKTPLKPSQVTTPPPKHRAKEFVTIP